MAMMLSIYIVVAIYSVVYSYRRLMRPGVSKEVRSMFFQKHRNYVCIFIVLWTIQQSQNYYQLFNPNTDLVTVSGVPNFNNMNLNQKLGVYLGFHP